jgi:cobalt-zinc-cadmium efflux system protein
MTRVTRLSIVLGLNVVLLVVLVIVGVKAHSLSVLAAGGDYLADAAAVGVSLLAIWLSRRPPTARRPRGYPKATSIAALINGMVLLAVVTVVFVEAVRRLAVGTSRVDGLPVLIVSAVAAVVMVIGALILLGDVAEEADGAGDRANVRAILLDTVADAAAAAGVALTGAVILATHGLYWLDPVVALVISAVIGYHVVVLLREVVKTLRGPLDQTPERFISR